MLRRLLGLTRSPNEQIVETVYGEIVAAARRPELYSRLGVPDTPLGRFEMIALHLMLVLHRFSRPDEPEAVRQILQELTDEFFRDVEHSIRELGIGDMGVPKRMKKLARMFYGRAEAYGAALRADDRQALAEALARNVRPDEQGWAGAGQLADHVRAVSAVLAASGSDDLLAGRIAFPAGGSQPA